MKRNSTFGLILTLIVLAPALALAEPAPPTAQELIRREGRFLFTDGSSYYAFEKDGSFHSGPLGVSGRTIEGKWKPDGAKLIVEGRWGWLNGLSARDDRRRMTFGISGPLTPLAGKTPRLLRQVKGPLKVHSCYFVIDELIRLPK